MRKQFTNESPDVVPARHFRKEHALKAIIVLTAAFCLMAAQFARADEMEAVQARADEFAKAFNAHDAQAMAEFFTEDGSLLDPAGNEFEGKEHIKQYFENIEKGQDKDASETTKVKRAKLIKPDVAIADWEI